MEVKGVASWLEFIIETLINLDSMIAIEHKTLIQFCKRQRKENCLA